MNYIYEILESLAFICVAIIMIKILSINDVDDVDDDNDKSFFKVKTLKKIWVFFIGFEIGCIILNIIALISK